MYFIFHLYVSQCGVPCTKPGKWPLLYYRSFLCVLHFNVVFLLCRSSLIIDAFPSDLVGNSDLFFLYRVMNFEQRYTTVAFIWCAVHFAELIYIVVFDQLRPASCCIKDP